VTRFRRAAILLPSVALAALATPLAAQDELLPVSPVSFPVRGLLAWPQGEFADNVNFAGGIGGGALWSLNGVLGLRADLGFMLYGSETRRVPLGGGALGLIDVDVTTTNAIVGGTIGAQLGVPGPSVRPYFGGSIGFANFNTTSRVAGANSSDEAFASSTNSSDNAFSKSTFLGLYIPVGRGTTMFDIGVKYTWNGEEVEYLTPGDINEDLVGNIVITPRRSRADMLTVTIGATVRPTRSRPR
jgi:hypothetical protein